MSGRPKAAPVTQAEELRELTRGLHEAAQDARAAARELREVRATVEDSAEETIAGLLSEAHGQIQGLINRRSDELQKSFDDSNRRIEQHQAELMGAKSPEEVYAWVAEMVTGVTKSEEFTAQVARYVAGNMPVGAIVKVKR